MKPTAPFLLFIALGQSLLHAQPEVLCNGGEVWEQPDLIPISITASPSHHSDAVPSLCCSFFSCPRRETEALRWLSSAQAVLPRELRWRTQPIPGGKQDRGMDNPPPAQHPQGRQHWCWEHPWHLDAAWRNKVSTALHTKIPLLLTTWGLQTLLSMASPQPPWAPDCMARPGSHSRAMGLPCHQHPQCHVPAASSLRFPPAHQDSRSLESRSSSFWLSMAFRCWR